MTNSDFIFIFLLSYVFTFISHNIVQCSPALARKVAAIVRRKENADRVIICVTLFKCFLILVQIVALYTIASMVIEVLIK